MNDELPTQKPNAPTLDARFARRPHAYARLQQIANMMDQAIAEGCTADEAEARAVEQIRHLGRDILSDWAQEKKRKSLEQARLEHPHASQHVKKSKVVHHVWGGGNLRTAFAPVPPGRTIVKALLDLE
jgi:hypothetical protein